MFRHAVRASCEEQSRIGEGWRRRPHTHGRTSTRDLAITGVAMCEASVGGCAASDSAQSRQRRAHGYGRVRGAARRQAECRVVEVRDRVVNTVVEVRYHC